MIEPLQCVENIVTDLELPSFQNRGVQECLSNKKMLLAFDTGTGKTITYSVFVRALLNRNPESKHIFVIIHDSIEQAPRDIRSLTSVPVAVFSGKEGEYKKLRRSWNNSSIFVMTYESFRIPDVIMFLYEHLREVESFTIDEAHHIANWDTSDTAFIIRALCRTTPYVVALSATPITSQASQYYQLMNVIDRHLSYRRDETFLGKYTERYFPVNRDDYNIKGKYKVRLELVTPELHQVGHIRGIISRVIKGTGAVNQVECLLRLVRERLQQGKSVIIYVNYHDTRDWVESHLHAEGISFVSLHGKVTKREERSSILQTFGNRQVQVLITSVAESLNIDSDVVIFYEFTTKLKQVMGRAHRGLDEKELELVFIITKDTEEVDFFLEYIYRRSLVIQKLLKKDYSEFVDIGEKLLEVKQEE